MTRSQWAAFAFIIFVVFALLATNVGVDSGVAVAETPSFTPLDGPPPVLGPGPDLSTGAAWLNGGPVAGNGPGAVRVVYFWSENCGPCERLTPWINSLHQRWSSRGVVVVGVVSPLYPGPVDDAVLAQSLAQAGVNWPVLSDPDQGVADQAQGGRVGWPRVMVVDGAGALRLDLLGPGRQGPLEATVSYLVEEGS